MTTDLLSLIDSETNIFFGFIKLARFALGFNLADDLSEATDDLEATLSPVSFDVHVHAQLADRSPSPRRGSRRCGDRAPSDRSPIPYCESAIRRDDWPWSLWLSAPLTPEHPPPRYTPGR